MDRSVAFAEICANVAGAGARDSFCTAYGLAEAGHLLQGRLQLSLSEPVPSSRKCLRDQRGPLGTPQVPYPSSSSSIACISLRAWRLPVRAAHAIPAFSFSTASPLRPTLARVCADMK